MLAVVAPGTSFSVEAYFKNPDGSAFVMAAPPQFNIRDFNGSLVLNGVGQQDPAIPARWTATVTLPDQLPIDAERKYVLNWYGQNNSTNMQFSEAFSVLPTTDYTFVENDKVVLAKGAITDALVLPIGVVVTDVTWAVKDEGGTVLREGAVTSGVTVGDKVVWACNTGTIQELEASQTGMRPYIVEWNYRIDQLPQIPEYHFMYVITTKILLVMNDVRRMIDKARNEDIIASLRYSEVDLVHHVQQGLARLNSEPPQFTSWTVDNLPMQFNILLTYAAAYDALNARLLAEGESSFDFSGQSVSLSVDRTSALESAISRLDQYLSANLGRTKKLYAKTNGGRGNSAGVLGMQLGPSTNRMRNAEQILDRMLKNQGLTGYRAW